MIFWIYWYIWYIEHTNQYQNPHTHSQSTLPCVLHAICLQKYYQDCKQGFGIDKDQIFCHVLELKLQHEINHVLAKFCRESWKIMSSVNFIWTFGLAKKPFIVERRFSLTFQKAQLRRLIACKPWNPFISMFICWDCFHFPASRNLGAETSTGRPK